jgi:hypothetical protein
VLIWKSQEKKNDVLRDTICSQVSDRRIEMIGLLFWCIGLSIGQQHDDDHDSQRFPPLTSEKNKPTIPEEQPYRPLAWVASNFACWLQQHGLHHKKKEQQTDKKSKFPCVYRQRRLPTVLELSGSGSGSELGTLDMDRAWAYQPPSEPASGVRHSVF